MSEPSGNHYYSPGTQRASKVADLFGKIAARYDLINDLQSFGLHRLWKRRLIKLAGPAPGDVVLDLCCGTGDIAIALARKGAQATGLDFSAPMLAVAQERKRKLLAHHPNLSLEFVQGDALNTPFQGNSFHAITVGYGLRNLASVENGLQEMLRLAKPGGKILVLDFGKPDNPALRWAYFQYLKWFVPVFGKLFCNDSAAYSYILESLENYPAQRGVAEIMNKLGLEEVRIYNLLGGIMSINIGRKRK